MNTNFILSIIIPTRNRAEYAYSAINQILKNTSGKVQVVIQDNSDNEVLFEKISTIPNWKDRIKYSHSEELLSFVDNFSRGVEISDGEYLCMIGDDDGINPEIESVAKWAKQNCIEAIAPEIKLNYIWPGTGIDYFDQDTGNLMIIDFDSQVEVFDTEKEVNRLLSTGGQNYLQYNMVKIYHGIVTKAAMDKVRNITGRYFGGLSPDIYSAIALSLVVKKVVRINYPLTIPGVCRKSGAGHSSTGRHHGELKTAPQLAGHENYKWSSLVPQFYSVETLWADTALAAFTDMRRNDLILKFDVATLSAYCYKNYKEFSNYTDDNYKKYLAGHKINCLYGKLKLINGYLKGPISDFLRRVKNRMNRGAKAVENHTNVLDINEAYMILNEYLVKKKRIISQILKEIKL